MERRTAGLVVWRASDVAYADGLQWQQAALTRALEGRGRGERAESLALIEHRPVVTLGARAERRHLVVTEQMLAARGVEVFATDRGGDVTYHGPGQLVAYPILDLRSRGVRVGDYVRVLEAALIDVAAAFSVASRRIEGRPGVWVDERTKLAAIGVRVTQGVTRHGLALNVSTDLAAFDDIVPCGLEGTRVTSLSRELGAAPPMADVADRLVAALDARLGLDVPQQGEVAA